MSPNQGKRPAWDELDASLSRHSLERQQQQKRVKLLAGCDPFNVEAANAINGMFDRVIAIASSHIPHLAKARKPRLTALDSDDHHSKPQERDTIATPWHPMTPAEKAERSLEIRPGFRKSTWSTLPSKPSIVDKPVPTEHQSHQPSQAVATTSSKQWTPDKNGPESESGVVELLSSSDEEVEDDQDLNYDQEEDAEYSEEGEYDPDVQDAEDESVEYNDELDEYDENHPIQFLDSDEGEEMANAYIDRPRQAHSAMRTVPDHSKRHYLQQERYSDQGSSPIEGSIGDHDDGLDNNDLHDEDVAEEEESDHGPIDDEAEEYSEGDYEDEEEEDQQTAEGPLGGLPATNSDPYILLDSSDEEAPDSQKEEPSSPGDEYDEQGADYGRDEEYDEQVKEYSGQDEESDRLDEQGDAYDGQQGDINPHGAGYDAADVQSNSVGDQSDQAPMDVTLESVDIELTESSGVTGLGGVSYTESSSQIYFESRDTIGQGLANSSDMALSVDQMQSDTQGIQFLARHDLPVEEEFVYTQEATFTHPNQYMAATPPLQSQASVPEQPFVTHDMNDVHLLANFLEVHQEAGPQVEPQVFSQSHDANAVISMESIEHIEQVPHEEAQQEEPIEHEEPIEYENPVEDEEPVEHKEPFEHDEPIHKEEQMQHDEPRYNEEFNQQGDADHRDVPSLTDEDIIPMETEDIIPMETEDIIPVETEDIIPVETEEDGTTSQQVEESAFPEATPEVNEEPQEFPRKARLQRSGTMAVTAREGRAFMERQERLEGTSIEGRTRPKANSVPTMVTRKAVTSESQQTKDTQEDDPEASSSSPRYLPEADFGRSTPPSTARRTGGEVELLVKEAREFCGRVSPSSRTGSSPGSLGGNYSAPVIAPPPLGNALPSDPLNADSLQGHVIEWSRDVRADTASPQSTTASTTRMTPTKGKVVDLAEENVIQSTVVGSHALRKFIHPPASMGASSHATNVHSSGSAQSRSSSLEPAISPRTQHNNNVFSFGQNPLGLTFGAPPTPPALGLISVSPSKNVGFDFGSGIVPGGAVARDQIMARSSPHKTRALPSAPMKLGSEEHLYPAIEDDLDGKPEGLAQDLKDDGEPGPNVQEEQEEDDEPSSEEEEEADAPDTGSSSSSPLFVRKTKKKRSLTQIKARNKARREAAKSQKLAGNRE